MELGNPYVVNACFITRMLSSIVSCQRGPEPTHHRRVAHRLREPGRRFFVEMRHPKTMRLVVRFEQAANRSSQLLVCSPVTRTPPKPMRQSTRPIGLNALDLAP